MRVFVLVDELRECLRFLEGSQVLALNVLDEGQLDRFQIVDVPLDARESRSGSPEALPDSDALPK